MKKYSAFCFLLIGIFYIIQVSVLGYTVYFLSENGWAVVEIGILMAAFGIVAAFTQPLLGFVADKNNKIDFKSILTCAALIVTVLFVLLLFFDKNKIVIGILFGITFVMTNSMSPFVNSSCFYYKDRGINVDFGKARGFGSFSFAITSYILGSFTKIFGTKSISLNGIIATIIFFIVVLLMPRIKKEDYTVEEKHNDIVSNDGKIQFILIKKYPSFFLIVIATTLAMCFQNADCGYLIEIIEELGGNSSNLGLANAIAAISEIPIMFLISKIMNRIKVKKLIAIACAFYVLRGFVFHISSMKAIYIAQLMQMLSYAILIPSTVYLSDEMMQDEDKNKGQTFIGMAITIGLILGSFIGGQLVSAGGTDLLEIGCIVIAILSFIFAMLGILVK